MVELLFSRLPAAMRQRAITRLARFVTTTTLPSVTQETAILCNAAGWSDAHTTAQQLLEPLLAQLESELPALQRSSVAATTGATVSKVSINQLRQRPAGWAISTPQKGLVCLAANMYRM